jgi:hypothetical protein
MAGPHRDKIPFGKDHSAIQHTRASTRDLSNEQHGLWMASPGDGKMMRVFKSATAQLPAPFACLFTKSETHPLWTITTCPVIVGIDTTFSGVTGFPHSAQICSLTSAITSSSGCRRFHSSRASKSCRWKHSLGGLSRLSELVHIILATTP